MPQDSMNACRNIIHHQGSQIHNSVIKSCLTKKKVNLNFLTSLRLNLFTNKKYVIKLVLFALQAFRTFDFFFPLLIVRESNAWRRYLCLNSVICITLLDINNVILYSLVQK